MAKLSWIHRIIDLITIKTFNLATLTTTTKAVVWKILSFSVEAFRKCTAIIWLVKKVNFFVEIFLTFVNFLRRDNRSNPETQNHLGKLGILLQPRWRHVSHDVKRLHPRCVRHADATQQVLDCILWSHAAASGALDDVIDAGADESVEERGEGRHVSLPWSVQSPLPARLGLNTLARQKRSNRAKCVERHPPLSPRKGVGILRVSVWRHRCWINSDVIDVNVERL